MGKRRIADLPTEEGSIIEVDIYYELGGYNYGTSKNRPRGYYLSVAPITPEGKYKAYSGVVTKIQDAKRFSPRVMEEYIPDRYKLENLVEKVLNKNNLTLKKS